MTGHVMATHSTVARYGTVAVKRPSSHRISPSLHSQNASQ